MIRLGKSFANLKDLEKYLQKKINETLLYEVSDAVKDELQSSVSDVVYSAGTPKQYERRNLRDGSLGDKSTMNSSLINDGILEVSPDADRNVEFSEYPGWGYDSDKSLAENVAFGYGNHQYWWNQERNFVEDAKENMKRNKAHVDSMKDGLRARGLEVL